MLELNHQIDSAVNSARDEIVSFIQTLVQSPSLANDEGLVQSIILDKLESLGLAAEKVPVRFDELKEIFESQNIRFLIDNCFFF